MLLTPELDSRHANCGTNLTNCNCVAYRSYSQRIETSHRNGTRGIGVDRDKGRGEMDRGAAPHVTTICDMHHTERVATFALSVPCVCLLLPRVMAIHWGG